MNIVSFQCTDMQFNTIYQGLQLYVVNCDVLLVVEHHLKCSTQQKCRKMYYYWLLSIISNVAQNENAVQCIFIGCCALFKM